MPLKKPDATKSSTSGMRADSWQGSVLDLYPELMEFLSLAMWEDGSPRQVGLLQLSTGQGRWQGKLKDPDSKRYCFATGETLEQLLGALNAIAKTGEGDWRADEWAARSNGHKR
jgi:hypothetical protein